MARKVLIADDEPNIVTSLEFLLEKAGYEVKVARSGEEALELVESFAPDAVLLDVMMPTMDGPSTFGRLQDEPRTRSVPVILLTAKVQPAERRQYEGLGVAGVLAKPFDPLTLPDQISGLLGWRD